jgi:hypothetical protein
LEQVPVASLSPSILGGTNGDDPTKRDYRDRERINIHEEYELHYWSKELGVTPQKLKEAVDEVGVMVVDVRKALAAPKIGQPPV